MEKRLLSIILSSILTIGVLPLSVNAASGDLLFSLNIGNTITDSSNTGNSTLSVGAGIETNSFINENGETVKYVQFTNDEETETDKLEATFTEAIAKDASNKSDDITIEFWANISGRTDYEGYNNLFILGSNVLKMETLNGAQNNRYKVDKGNVSSVYLGSAQRGANVVDTWAHFVITQDVSVNATDNSKRDYTTTVYVNGGAYTSTNTQTAQAATAAIENLVIGDCDSNKGVPDYKLASFNVYEGINTSVLSNYATQKDNYKQKAINVLSHTTGNKVKYPVTFSGNTIATSTQSLQVQFDNGEWETVTVNNGNWNYTVPEGTYGEKKVKFSVFNADSSVASTETLNLNFVKNTTISDLEANISANTAVTGSLTLEENFTCSYKVLVALFKGGKMLEYDEATSLNREDYTFSMNSYADVEGLFVKAFVVDDLTTPELLSNVLIYPNDATDSIETPETLSEVANGVNISSTQYDEENSFKISVLSSKKYKNDGVVLVKTPGGDIDYINAVAIENNGYGAVKYVVNTLVEDQNYSVYSSISGTIGEDTFKIISQEAINDTLSAIEGTLPENFETDILNNIIHTEILALDMANYNGLTGEGAERKTIINEAISGKNYGNLAEFKGAFSAACEEQSVLYLLQNTALESYASELESMNGLVEANLDGLYTKLTLEQKIELITTIRATRYYSYVDLKRAIKETMALYVINNISVDEIISKAIIEEYDQEFGITISDKNTYCDMANKNKKKVLARVKNAAPESFADINAYFTDSVVFISNPENITYAPIMVVDISNANAESTNPQKGIVLDVGEGMSITEAAITGDGKYQTKSGSKVNYVELNGEDSKITINMGNAGTQEATLSFWANIDSSVIANNGNTRVNIFNVKSGTSNLIKSAYWLHERAGKSITIQGDFDEKYTSGDLNFDAWNHYVFTYKWNDLGTTVEYAMYINGAYKAGNTQTRSVASHTNDLTLTFGSGAKLRVTDMAYYNESLDASYIEELFSSELLYHEPASINLDYDNKIVAYPYVLNGEVYKESNQKFEVSEDGVSYTPVTSMGTSWSYTFDNGELGTRNIKFRIINVDGTTSEEITVPINFGHPLVLSDETISGVKVSNRRETPGSASVGATVVAVVYNGTTVTEVKTVGTTAPLANGETETLFFTFSTVNPTAIRYIAFDSINEMNILAESVFYPNTATDIEAIPADIIPGNLGINADISYIPDIWKTSITIATTEKVKNAAVAIYDKNNVLVYVGEAEFDANGKCALCYTPNIVLTNENYIAKVKAGTKSKDITFRYNTQTTIDTTLLAVRNSNSDNFEQDILNNETHRYALLVDLTAFNELEPYYRNNVSTQLSGKTYASVALFKDAFLNSIKEQTILQDLFKTTTLTADNFLKKYETELGITLSEAYDLITSEVYKNQLLTNSVCGKRYTNKNAFKVSFFENSMLLLFNFYQPLQIVENNLIEIYATKFNLNPEDVTTYTGYAHERKLAVIDAMKLAGINSYTSLRSTFNTSLSAQPQGTQQGTGSGSGGSSGFGGGSGVVLITPTKLPEPIDEEYAQAIADSIFRDLRTDHWAYDSIENLVNLGVLNGVGNGKFEPESIVTREQFVKMILVALDIKIDDSNVCNFDDVDKGAWYYSYIATAENLGIVSGISNSKFGTGSSITRAEMCAIICRAVDNSFNRITASSEDRSFNDFNSVPQFAKEQVKLLSKAGIVNGFDDGSFKPNDTANRAMAAKVIDNLLNNFK